MKIQVSDVKLCEETLTPYLELDFQTRISLDQEMFTILRMHDVSLLELMIDEYKTCLMKTIKENETLQKLIKGNQ